MNRESPPTEGNLYSVTFVLCDFLGPNIHILTYLKSNLTYLTQSLILLEIRGCSFSGSVLHSTF